MHTLAELEKQQAGLRLHKYIVDEIDEFTKQFSVNRTDVIVEAIKSYISIQKEKMFYQQFDESCKELTHMINSDSHEPTLQELINELKTNPNT